MPVRLLHRITASILALGIGTAVAASDDDVRVQAQFFAQVRALQAQKKAAQPPTKQPKIGPTVMLDVMPEGAIAKLGDSRLRHAAPATCVTFSPDGRQIITGGQDSALRVWDTATGAAQRAIGIGFIPTSINFTHNGSRLAISVSDSQVRFHNPTTFESEPSFQPINGSNLALSADGKMTASIIGTALVVTEVESGLAKLELPLESPTGNHFAFHPDGKTIAVAQRTGKVAFHMLAGGKPLYSFDHGSPLTGLMFRPDGKRLVTGGLAPSENVKVWDVDAIKTAKNPKPLAEVVAATKPKAWLSDDRLALSGRDGAGVYDLNEKKWLGQIKEATGEWALSPDGTKLAATGNGALRVRVWDLATGKQLHAENDTFPDTALIMPTTDGKSLFLLAGDSAFHWLMSTKEALAAGKIPARAITAAANGGRLAVATPDAVLVYDDFDPSKPLASKPSRTLTEFAAAARSVAVSPDGKKIAYSGDGVRVVIADAATGKTVRILPTQTVGLALSFSPDGKSLAVLGRDAFLRLWSASAVAEGAEDADLWKARVQRGLKGAVAFSPDGKYVAASSSTILIVVDAKSGDAAFQLDRRDLDDGIFNQVAFSPDSRLIITSSAGLTGAIHMFEVATHSLVRRYTTGFGGINRLSLFPDGMKVASAGAEEVITVWDLSFRSSKTALAVPELALAWGNLDAPEGAKGYVALGTLTSGGISGVRVIAAGIDEIAENQKRIMGWVKDLASEDFDIRENASKALLSQGIPGLLAVQAAAASAESQEARTRAADISMKLTAKGFTVPNHGLAGDTLRLVRAVHVLESVGGPESKVLLDKIANLGGRPAAEAKAALNRVEK